MPPCLLGCSQALRSSSRHSRRTGMWVGDPQLCLGPNPATPCPTLLGCGHTLCPVAAGPESYLLRPQCRVGAEPYPLTLGPDSLLPLLAAGGACCLWQSQIRTTSRIWSADMGTAYVAHQGKRVSSPALVQPVQSAFPWAEGSLICSSKLLAKENLLQGASCLASLVVGKFFLIATVNHLCCNRSCSPLSCPVDVIVHHVPYGLWQMFYLPCVTYKYLVMNYNMQGIRPIYPWIKTVD